MQRSENNHVRAPLESVHRSAALEIINKIDDMMSLPEGTSEHQVLGPLDEQAALFCSIFKGEIIL